MARLFRDGRKVNMGGLVLPICEWFLGLCAYPFFGNGYLGCRPDGGSLLKSPQAGLFLRLYSDPIVGASLLAKAAL